MALIDCPECAYLVSDKARACVNCGYPVYDESLRAGADQDFKRNSNGAGGDGKPSVGSFKGQVVSRRV